MKVSHVVTCSAQSLSHVDSAVTWTLRSRGLCGHVDRGTPVSTPGRPWPLGATAEGGAGGRGQGLLVVQDCESLGKEPAL